MKDAFKLLTIVIPCLVFGIVYEYCGAQNIGDPGFVGQLKVTASGSSVVATDDFNRADGGLGANWTIQTGANMAISGNLVTTTTTSTDQLAFWNADAFNNNQYSKWKAQVSGGSGLPGVTVRASATGGSLNAYFANSAGIHKFVAGVYTQLLSDSLTLADGDTLELRVSGTTLERYHNGVLDGSVTDSSLSSGSAGILQYTTGSAVKSDDWEGGNL